MVSIAAFSFHPAFYPPKSGGEQRLYHIYKNLSLKNRINLITFTYPNDKNEVEVVIHGENFKEIRIPKTTISMLIHHFINRFTSIKECSAIVTSIESRLNINFRIIANDEIKNADIVIFIFPYLFTVDKDILENKKIIYESHNMEHELMKQSLGDSLFAKLLLRYVYSIEKSLSKKSNLIFAVSEEDKLKLSSTYGLDESKIIVSPNGINSEDFSEYIENVPGNIKRCVFIGSFHPPNIEAVDNIIEIARQMPDISFAIAGGAAQYYVNSANGLVEQAEIESLTSYNPNNPIILSGFYEVERWGSTPTMWSMPDFKIWASKPINFLEVKLYSVFSQKLKIRFGDKIEHYAIIEGFNEVRIPLEDKMEKTVYFSCEKIHSDQKRVLGVAVQEIAYCIGSEKEYLDITHRSQLPFKVKAARNVVLLGQISDEEKLKLYRSVDVALNPMQSGSGTNIKMLDYMAAGLPVISTPVGARGLEIESYNEAIICELPDFPRKIRELLEDKQLRNTLIYNGRKLVKEKYDWKRIADDMDKTLKSVLS